MNRGRPVRHVIIDTNFWKTQIHHGLATAEADRGAISLYGHRPEDHRMLAAHVTAETRTRVTGPRGAVDEWHLRPEKPDNHLFDCLAGAAVAASMLGMRLSGPEPADTPTRKVRPRRRVHYAT